jgi:hypothetical protein
MNKASRGTMAYAKLDESRLPLAAWVKIEGHLIFERPIGPFVLPILDWNSIE